jgi:hypothetical protein
VTKPGGTSFAVPENFDRSRAVVRTFVCAAVATLADAQFPAGFHAVAWGAGERAGVGPGIYVYRLSAGMFRSQRKMILLP